LNDPLDQLCFPIDCGDFKLRPVCENDATEAYASWLRDAETTKFLESGSLSESPESIKAYIQKTRSNPKALFLAIVLHDNAEHVGNVKLEPIEWGHRCATLGIMIGAPSARGRGLGERVVREVVRLAFADLKLNRVMLGVASDNLAGVRCYEKVGFVIEGRLRQACRREHGFVDSLIMGILAEDFAHAS